MPTPAIIHLSDLHLLGDEERREHKQDELLRSLVAALGRLAATGEFAPSLLAITGDVFDTSQAPPSAIQRFVELVGELRRALGAAVPCLVLPGNHDRRRTGVVGPHDPALFEALAAERIPDTTVTGRETPFLVEWLPAGTGGLRAHLAAYDSTYLPRGLISAGGWVRTVDVLEISEELRRRGDADGARLPLVLFTHHHLVPTPLTDVGEIEFGRLPAPVRKAAQWALSGLIANGDREELTMTALGAGSALTLLHALDRAVVVLHGHKHYPTVRLLRGLLPDQGDVVMASAGGAGLVEKWHMEGALHDFGIWPSFNVVALDEARLTVEHVAFADDRPHEPYRRRTLVALERAGARFSPAPFKLNRGARPTRLALDERRCRLTASDASPEELWDVDSTRTLEGGAAASLGDYKEAIRGCPGARAALIDDAAGMRRDVKLPDEASLRLDGETRYLLTNAACQRRAVAARWYGPETAYEWLGLLVRYGARRARLVLSGLPDGDRIAFGGATDLTTGFETPLPLQRAGGDLVLEYADCPPRTRLRILWPLVGW